MTLECSNREVKNLFPLQFLDAFTKFSLLCLLADVLWRTSLHPLHPHGDQWRHSVDRHNHTFCPQLHSVQNQRVVLLLLYPGGSLHHQKHPCQLSWHGHWALHCHLCAFTTFPDVHSEKDLHSHWANLVHNCGSRYHRFICHAGNRAPELLSWISVLPTTDCVQRPDPRQKKTSVWYYLLLLRLSDSGLHLLEDPLCSQGPLHRKDVCPKSHEYHPAAWSAASHVYALLHIPQSGGHLPSNLPQPNPRNQICKLSDCLHPAALPEPNNLWLQGQKVQEVPENVFSEEQVQSQTAGSGTVEQRQHIKIIFTRTFEERVDIFIWQDMLIKIYNWESPF